MSHQEAFEQFHQENPSVYTRLVAMAKQYRKERGPAAKVGIATLWENLRWSFLITRSDDFKLNNNHRAYYARKIMAENADLEGIFDVRSRETA